MYAEEDDPHLIDTPKHSATDVVICLNAALAGSSNYASFPTPRRKSEHPWTIELRRGYFLCGQIHIILAAGVTSRW